MRTEVIGRVDKKFCSDYCRNAYNNKKNRDSKNIMLEIQTTFFVKTIEFRKTQSDQKTKTTKDNMLRKGFNFNYFTSIYKTKAGKFIILFTIKAIYL